VLTPADCAYGFGTYQGDGAVCSPNPCTQPPDQGACCDDAGACRLAASTACAGANDFYLGAGSTCTPSPCFQDVDMLGIWSLEMEERACGADSVLFSMTFTDTICTVNDPYDPGDSNSECIYSNHGSELVSVCTYTHVVDQCVYEVTSISRATFSSSTYSVQGRSVTTISGSGCQEPASCYDFTVHGTRTGPPPDPCAGKAVDDVKRALVRRAIESLQRE
jgi:hypothetical protein